MPTPFEHLMALNRLVHEPARLAILVALSACEKADFVFLRNLTGLIPAGPDHRLPELNSRVPPGRGLIKDTHSPAVVDRVHAFLPSQAGRLAQSLRGRCL